MLNEYRDHAAPWLDRMAERFDAWTPDEVSWLSFGLFALGAALLLLLRVTGGLSPWIPPLLFFGVAVAVFLGGVFDALDGHLARRRGVASPTGDLLDHVLDRYADLLLLLGIAVSGWAQPVLALLALASLLLVSYMGTQAQAVLGRRLYSGLLGRADRIVLVSGMSLLLSVWLLGDLIFPWAPKIPYRWSVGGLSLTPWDLLLLFFAVVGQITAFVRARRTWQELKARATPAAGKEPARRESEPASSHGNS